MSENLYRAAGIAQEEYDEAYDFVHSRSDTHVSMPFVSSNVNGDPVVIEVGIAYQEFSRDEVAALNGRYAVDEIEDPRVQFIVMDGKKMTPEQAEAHCYVPSGSELSELVDQSFAFHQRAVISTRLALKDGAIVEATVPVQYFAYPILNCDGEQIDAEPRSIRAQRFLAVEFNDGLGKNSKYHVYEDDGAKFPELKNMGQEKFISAVKIVMEPAPGARNESLAAPKPF